MLAVPATLTTQSRLRYMLHKRDGPAQSHRTLGQGIACLSFRPGVVAKLTRAAALTEWRGLLAA
ncbi:MAG: hypothetical protein JWS10_141 [Cypionkella sp.]|uniref:hypothetical protein n=1 Tax=Cypionkella sp. TaxID=2811411 RepID=UPI00262C7496|nr:hypothetical protein [Cypionkella sp.]MDB5657526.1 hypothetical protein [Cypionkella sp.]